MSQPMLRLAYEYEAYYSNAYYAASFYIPVSILVKHKLTQKDFEGHEKWLGEIEGKHSEVNAEITTEMLNEMTEPPLRVDEMIEWLSECEDIEFQCETREEFDALFDEISQFNEQLLDESRHDTTTITIKNNKTETEQIFEIPNSNAHVLTHIEDLITKVKSTPK